MLYDYDDRELDFMKDKIEKSDLLTKNNVRSRYSKEAMDVISKQAKSIKMKEKIEKYTSTFIVGVAAGVLGNVLNLVPFAALGMGASVSAFYFVGSTYGKKLYEKIEGGKQRKYLALQHQRIMEFENIGKLGNSISATTSYYIPLIENYIKNFDISLENNVVRRINQVLYLLNANYYSAVLKKFPTLSRKQMISQTLNQLFAYLIQNQKLDFTEKDLKKFLKGYELLDKDEKRLFFLEFKSGKVKKEGKHQYIYAVFPKELSEEDVRAIDPRFQLKETQDSHQLDLTTVQEIQQEISKLSFEEQKEYNSKLKEILQESKNSSLSVFELRTQLFHLFADVKYAEKSTVQPEIYREFFQQFSFFITGCDFDEQSFKQEVSKFYFMVQSLENHKVEIDFVEFLELHSMVTNHFCNLLFYHENLTADILGGMTDSYKTSVSLKIREQLNGFLQQDKLPPDYLSIYALNQGEVPIDHYIAKGIHILRNHEGELNNFNQRQYIVHHS